MADTATDILALEQQVCFALAVASRSVLGLYRPILEPMGLTHPQYLVLLALWEKSPRTVKELGAVLQLEPATLSPLLKRLENNGLVSRTRSAADERVLLVALTEAGTALRAEAEKVPLQVIAKLQMSVDQLDELRGTLHKVIGAAQRSQASGTPDSAGRLDSSAEAE